jgi:hypothetical protein
VVDRFCGAPAGRITVIRCRLLTCLAASLAVARLPASRSPPRQAHQRQGRTARTRLNVDDSWCEALFASALQRSAAPIAESVAAAISRAVRRLGTRSCVSRMAQEFGDHPRRPPSGCAGSAGSPPRRLPRRPASPGPRPPAWRDHPRQLLTSATSTEGTRHSEADTGPAAPAAPRGQRTAARGIPRPGHPAGPAGQRTRRTEDAITDDLPRR